jgi:hypothetical protein
MREDPAGLRRGFHAIAPFPGRKICEHLCFAVETPQSATPAGDTRGLQARPRSVGSSGRGRYSGAARAASRTSSRTSKDVPPSPPTTRGAPFLPLWGSFLHALAEAATGFPAGRLRASLHPTAEAAATQAAEPPREPFAKATETASRRTATRALGKALLGLVGCGGVLIRRCHRVGPLLVPVADGPEATVGIGWPTTRLPCTTPFFAPRGTPGAGGRSVKGHPTTDLRLVYYVERDWTGA